MRTPPQNRVGFPLPQKRITPFDPISPTHISCIIYMYIYICVSISQSHPPPENKMHLRKALLEPFQAHVGGGLIVGHVLVPGLGPNSALWNVNGASPERGSENGQPQIGQRKASTPWSTWRAPRRDYFKKPDPKTSEPYRCWPASRIGKKPQTPHPPF